MRARIGSLLELLLARGREGAAEGITDSEMLRRFSQNRDEVAFELLVWRHGNMVLGLCRRALRDEQLAEDAFQAVFLVLARKAGRIRGNLGGWLFRVARRVSARGQQNRPMVQPVVEAVAKQEPDRAEREELRALLDGEIARLPERLRLAVVLCYLGGSSTEAAARELGCPRGTVLSRLATARKRLAERLTRRGVTLPASLAVAGVNAGLVSSTMASVRAVQTGSLAVSVATQLADGVLQSMNRLTLGIVAGGVVLVATLATGIGWGVAAQKPVEGEKQPAPVAAAPPAQPKAETKSVPPDLAVAEKAANEKIKKLEQFADSLRREIRVLEREIEVIAQTNAGEQRIHKLRDELDEEYRRATRELAKLEIEQSVLKELIEDKNAFLPTDPLLIQQAVDQDPTVMSARGGLHEARKAMLFVGQKNELIKEVQAAIAKAEKGLEQAKQEATPGAANRLQESERSSARQRAAKLRTEILIKKGVCDKLAAELDKVKKSATSARRGDAEIAALRKSLEPEREVLARVQQALLLARLEKAGVSLPDPTGQDAKLGEILNELRELRKEVRELREQKK